MATRAQQADAETFLPGLRVGEVTIDGGIAWVELIAPHANVVTCRIKLRIPEIEWIDEQERR